MVRLCKFGGSSLSDANGFRNAAFVMISDSRRRLAVFSAPGRRGMGDKKITDTLIALGNSAEKGRSVWREQKVLTDRFKGIENDLLGSTKISERFVSSIDERLTHSVDNLVSMGEEFSCVIMTAHLRREGINAGMFNPSTALPVRAGENGVFVHESDYPGIKMELISLLETYDVVCAPGFYGADERGERRLFPRGGSDYTAAVLSAAIKAECCEKFTDVEGIINLNDSTIIRSLSYSELSSITENCGIFQHEAVEPLMTNNIPMRITSSFNPMVEGTVVYPNLGEVA